MEDQDTKSPEIVRLMDATCSMLLDSVAAEYEDSFCLETFGDSIESAKEDGKHFILARVQTWDHKQPDRAFYSYYHAHHLNKLLFQTQIYLQKKLIHRLHVMNPLTNTDIIGNVLYFMVVGRSKKNPDGTYTRIETFNDAEAKSKNTSPEKETVARVETIRKDSVVANIPSSPSVAKIPPLNDPVALNRAIHNKTEAGPEAIEEQDEDEERNADSPMLSNEERQVTNDGWTLNGTVTGEIGTDEVDLEPKVTRKSSVRVVAEAITRRISNAGTRNDGFSQMDDDVEASIRGGSTDDRPKMPLRVLTDFKRFSISGAPQSATIVENRRRGANLKISTSVGQATQEPLSAYARAGITGIENQLLSPATISRVKNQVKVKAGIVTQRGEKLTPIQALAVVPPSARSRRRSLSYMNAIATSGSLSATIEDWKKMYRTHKGIGTGKDDPNDTLDQAAGKYDEVKPFGSPLEGKARDDYAEEYTYDAILLATDNDFLETSRVRTIFKDNAVNPNDAALFEMPPFTGETSQPRPSNPNDVPLPCDCCFPTEEQLNSYPIWLRLFHECKCYFLLVILTATLVAFITIAFVQTDDTVAVSAT